MNKNFKECFEQELTKMRESLGKTRGRKTMRMLSNKWEEPSASILYDKGNKGTYHQKDYSWHIAIRHKQNGRVETCFRTEIVRRMTVQRVVTTGATNTLGKY